tara:strand:+ start:4233 stop:4430 length:198 start_codon:yes stop_codon:yes gene_type:complete
MGNIIKTGSSVDFDSVGTWYSETDVLIVGGTPTQRACGFDDDIEEMYKDLTQASGPDADPAKVRL